MAWCICTHVRIQVHVCTCSIRIHVYLLEQVTHASHGSRYDMKSQTVSEIRRILQNRYKLTYELMDIYLYISVPAGLLIEVYGSLGRSRNGGMRLAAPP